MVFYREGVLLERERELAVVAEVLDSGGVLVIEGGAGIGKTSLLDAGCARARLRGSQVLRGCGSELETGFAFGVVRQLFERELAAADPRQRVKLLAGPAGGAGEFLAGRTGPPAQSRSGNAQDSSFGLVHGLNWLTVNMTAHQPVVVALDDAHLADSSSLRWLAYLAARLEGTRVAVIVALRPAEPVSQQGPLLAIRAMAPAVRPALLSSAAVAEIVRVAVGADISDARCDELRQACGGNPFYLGELLRVETVESRAGRGFEEPAGGAAADLVARRIEERIRRVDPSALGLARALAVLGDGGKLRHALVTLRYDLELRAPALAAELDAYLRRTVPAGLLRLCWAHMGIRLVDWAIRHHGPADVDRWLGVAEQGYGG